jgi:hypothetical protein
MPTSSFFQQVDAQRDICLAILPDVAPVDANFPVLSLLLKRCRGVEVKAERSPDWQRYADSTPGSCVNDPSRGAK